MEENPYFSKHSSQSLETNRNARKDDEDQEHVSKAVVGVGCSVDKVARDFWTNHRHSAVVVAREVESHLASVSLLTELVDWLENVAPHPILSKCETTWACAFSDCMNLLSLLIG